MNTWKKN